MERTLVLLKPSAIQRGLVGEVLQRFEKKGLILRGIKMMQLTDEILNEHYAHLSEKPFFQRVKEAMKITPIIAVCLEGIDAVRVVRTLSGSTNGRNADIGTIRGDLSMSFQENIVHTSDSVKNAQEELKRFFNKNEIFDYEHRQIPFLYANDEI